MISELRRSLHLHCPPSRLRLISPSTLAASISHFSATTTWSLTPTTAKPKKKGASTTLAEEDAKKPRARGRPKKSTKADGDEPPAWRGRKVPSMPDYSTFTIGQLTEELAKYGLKQMSKTSMVKHLGNRWKASNQGGEKSAIKELEKRTRAHSTKKDTAGAAAATEKSTATTSTGKKDTAKKVKAKKATAQEDMGEEVTKKATKKATTKKAAKEKTTTKRKASPRTGKKTKRGKARGKRQKRKRPVYKTESMTESLDPIAITRAIRMGAKEPNVSSSYYHHVLMYDPIIVEELTAWLNTEGLAAAGEDVTVTGEDVRRWCDANGVVGLRRITQRGKERTRF
ncbi:hypothetical protein EX30DRAFT_366449 [Ascodesmis nigricans]|uniref:Structure-specific endonuclease subunit SLX4 n=1 Tax=Ascodesmis nigricans TaxID=341454 RepID=A0A4S2MLF5_9PEZI|nr:hypothetical protein EX30DRAFT_366449 [Ascodesmis nigricans]